MAQERTKFLRYRRGDSSSPVTVGPGWLEVYSPALGALRDPGSVPVPPRGMRAQADFSRNVPLKQLDLLKDGRTGRVFVITQLADLCSIRRAYLAELYSPISDDFDTGIVEKFWTDLNTSDFSVNNQTGQLRLGTTNIVQGSLVGIPFLYQVAAGDFDVYAGLKVNAGSATVTHRILIKAAPLDPADEADFIYAAVGIESGTEVKFCHAQGNGASTGILYGRPFLAQSIGYVRLARYGGRISGWLASTSTPPASERDWAEMTNVNLWIGTDEVRLGVAGHSIGTLAGNPEMTWDFFRHWSPASR